MIENLVVYNFSSGLELPECVGKVFTLSTCQRSLILGLKKDVEQYISLYKINPTGDYVSFESEEAYQFLLETICGLKSKVVAEYEVVGQFRNAYKQFILKSKRNTFIQLVIEKLLKDSKKIRSAHLLKIGQLTYPGITRKLLLNKLSDYKQPILITGSGTLCEKLIKNLKKKFNITVYARNEVRAKQLSKLYGVETLSWAQRKQCLDFSAIINTIGCDEVLFNHQFFNKWLLDKETSLFVDLGSPTSIETSFSKAQNIYRLEDIFENGKELDQKKEQKVQLALRDIRQLTINRVNNLKVINELSQGDFQFA